MLFRNKIKGVLILFLISAPFYCLSQQTDDLERGNYYFDKAGVHFGKNSDSVLFYINKASEEYLNGKHWEEYIVTLNAYSSYYELNNDTKKRQEYTLMALNESEKHLDKTNLYRAISLNNHSASLRDIGNYTAAIKNYRAVLEIEKHNEKYDYVVGSLKNIGDTYKLIGDLEQAIKFYDECFNIEVAHPKSMGDQNKIDIYHRRGIAYLDLNNFSKAFANLKMAETLLPKEKIHKVNVNKYLAIEINYGYAKIQLARNNYDSLRLYIDKAFQYCNEEYEIEKGMGHILLGKYYLKNNDSQRAIDQLFLAKKQLDRYKRYARLNNFSEIYNLLGKAYLINGEDLTAIKYFKNAIYNLSNRSNEFNPDDLVPKLDQLFNPYLSMQAYAGIGDASYNLYKKNNNVEYLEAANQGFEIATNLIFDVRRSYQQNNSLLKLSEEVIPIYESAIQSAITMYELNGGKSNLVKAFDYNEKSKAILLLESINESSAIRFSDIPDSLIQREKELKYQITSINKKIYDELNVTENVNDFIIDQLKNQYFKDSEKYEALLRKFENEYPKYYQLKYDVSTVSIEDIQKKLENSETQIIEFFYGDKNTYVFSISENQININTVPINDSLKEDIQIVKDFLSAPPAGSNIQSRLSIYVKSSKNIFDEFIKKSIFPKTKHLVFIADGALGYLPFEALIIKDSESNNISYSLDNQAYLIEDYEVSYSYSSTLFLNSFNTVKKENQNTFFGVAPSFGLLNDKGTKRICNDNALFNLKCSQNEVLQIKNRLGGKVLLGKEATLKNTKEEISNSRIIHLATHACLDDNNPEFNKIYLADDYLSNNDLYNLKLNSELAVLSACETGSGKLAKGEGVMSLARGFIHAGCPSIIMSLWSIDDCATSKIMINFYDELYQGKPKTEALRNAKLKYIKDAKKANQHPYYWAAFVQIGNYDSIEFSSMKKYLSYSLGLLILILIFFIGRTKFKKI